MKKKVVNHLLFTYMLITCISLPVQGQNKEMLIEQIAEQEITRDSFDKSGQLINRQIFKVGELQVEKGKLSVKITTELYSSELKLKDRYFTIYQCNFEQSDMLVNVFPFADLKNKEIAVDVSSSDFKSLYRLTESAPLRDIRLTLKVESGVLNFFGSKNLIVYSNREKVMEGDSLKVTGAITVKAYLLGIKVKELNYEAVEYLSRNGVLAKQIFKEPEGSYFVMRYKSKGENN